MTIIPIPVKAAILRDSFPTAVNSVGEETLYRLLSPEITLSTPPSGEKFELTTMLEILKAAAPLVPLVVALIKALKPADKKSVSQVTKQITVNIVHTPEARIISQHDADGVARLVRRCAQALLREPEASEGKRD